MNMHCFTCFKSSPGGLPTCRPPVTAHNPGLDGCTVSFRRLNGYSSCSAFFLCRCLSNFTFKSTAYMKQLVYFLPFFLLWSSCSSDSTGNSEASTADTGSSASVDYELESVPNADYQLAFRYNEKGELAEEGRMRDGQKIGTWITYHPDGEFPAKMVNYANGNYHGPYFEFNDRGQIKLKAHYRNNLLHGDWASYRFGRTLKKAQYKEGELDGLYLEYDMKSGKLQKEINYKEGKQHGIFRFYDLSGNVIAEYEYKNGEKISGGMKE